MKCKDFGIKCINCKYCEECVIIVIEEDTPAKHTTIGWKCNKYDKYCVGTEPKKENMVLKEPEIEFKEYIGDDNVKMEIEFEDYYGNTVGEIIIERGDIYVKGRILPISKVEVADWESDNHVRLQSIKTNGGDNMENVEKLVIEEGKKERLEFIGSVTNDDGSITITFTNENLEDLEYGTEMMLYHLDMMLEKEIIYSHAYVGDDEDETKNVEITIKGVDDMNEDNFMVIAERYGELKEMLTHNYDTDHIEDFVYDLKFNFFNIGLENDWRIADETIQELNREEPDDYYFSMESVAEDLLVATRQKLKEIREL